MRGQFYAPLLGIVLLGIALLLAGQTLASERFLLSRIATLSSELRYIGYAEVADHDVWTSTEAFLRSAVYKFLSQQNTYLDRKNVEEWLEERTSFWTKTFFETFNEEVRESGLTIGFVKFPQVRVKSLRETKRDYVVLILEVKGGLLEINTEEGTLKRPVRPIGKFLVPMPLHLYRQVEMEVKKRARALDRCISKKPSFDFYGCSVRPYVEKEWEACEKLVRDAELVAGFYVPIFNTEGKRIGRMPGTVEALILRKRLQWTVPGMKGIRIETGILASENMGRKVFKGIYEGLWLAKVRQFYFRLEGKREDIEEKLRKKCEKPKWNCHRCLGVCNAACKFIE